MAALDASVALLLGDASPGARGELLDGAARCAELAGWVYQDAGDLLTADRWTARAADYALAGGESGRQRARLEAAHLLPHGLGTGHLARACASNTAESGTR